VLWILVALSALLVLVLFVLLAMRRARRRYRVKTEWEAMARGPRVYTMPGEARNRERTLL